VRVSYVGRRLFVSPSQLKSFVACERRWYLESQAGAPRDGDAGGQYLVYGRLVDQVVEWLVATPRKALCPTELVEAVKAARKGDELSTLDDVKWNELAIKAIGAARRLEGAKLLPPTGTPAQFKYRVEVPWSPVTLVGRADYRSAGRVWDLKTTSDRGPGKGPGGDRPPNALTDQTLREDFQARIYAAAEFFAQPTLASVSMRWVYTSSTTQAVWAATTFFTRAETIAWFDANVREAIFPRMIELAATEGLAVDEARANHDGCARCFIKGACSPFAGAQQHGTATEGLVNMDLAKLRARRAGAINRPTVGYAPVAPPPAEDRPTVGYAPVAPPPAEDDLVTPLRASLAPSPLAALAAEAAEASGGTIDDRRADVGHAHVGPPGTPGLMLPLQPVIQPVSSEAPAVALREAMAEDLAAAIDPPLSLAETAAILADVPAVALREPIVALIQAGEARAATWDEPPAPAAKRGRGRPRKPRPAPAEPQRLAIADAIEAELDRLGLALPPVEPYPVTRAPTAEESERIAALLAAAHTLQDARQTLQTAVVAALDAYAAAREGLRAQGVRFEGDPS
jgi:hypothetical protein